MEEPAVYKHVIVIIAPVIDCSQTSLPLFSKSRSTCVMLEFHIYQHAVVAVNQCLRL